MRLAASRPSASSRLSPASVDSCDAPVRVTASLQASPSTPGPCCSAARVRRLRIECGCCWAAVWQLLRCCVAADAPAQLLWLLLPRRRCAGAAVAQLLRRCCAAVPTHRRWARRRRGLGWLQLLV